MKCNPVEYMYYDRYLLQCIFCLCRNEAWRYHPGFKTEGYRARLAFLRGIQWGFAAFLVTIAIEKVWEKISPSDHTHGHH